MFVTDIKSVHTIGETTDKEFSTRGARQITGGTWVLKNTV